MIWFTADTHFDHANILKYTSRPFSTIEEMNEGLISNWNVLVKPGDTVYHLGDFAFKRHAYFAARLHGQIVLIEGSHDGMSAKEGKKFQRVGLMHIVSGDPDIILCHYAMRVWPKSHYGTWHLYGHSHGHLPFWGKSFDVGVDAHNMRPISLNAVRAWMGALSIEGGVDDRYKSMAIDSCADQMAHEDDVTKKEEK